jgi:hypothetical protein
MALREELEGLIGKVREEQAELLKRAQERTEEVAVLERVRERYCPRVCQPIRLPISEAEDGSVTIAGVKMEPAEDATEKFQAELAKRATEDPDADGLVYGLKPTKPPKASCRCGDSLNCVECHLRLKQVMAAED